MFEIIVNPAGAGGATMKMWAEVEPVFQASNQPYHVTYSTPNYNLDDITRDLTSKGTPVDIVIIGGDGSLNIAVNGIQDFSCVRLGFIPCGSGNDFAHAVGISKDGIACAKEILQKKVHRTLDVGLLTYYNSSHYCDGSKDQEDVKHRRFNISAGIGFDAAICEKVARSKFKKFLNKIHLGGLIYIIVAIEIIFSTKKVKTKITFDQRRPIDVLSLSTILMNTAYEGGGFKFCPAANAHDGMLDACICGNLSKWDFFRIFPYAYSGSHVKFKDIAIDQMRTVDIQTEQPMWVHTDGEVECMSSHIQVSMIADKLRYLN